MAKGALILDDDTQRTPGVVELVEDDMAREDWFS